MSAVGALYDRTFFVDSTKYARSQTAPTVSSGTAILKGTWTFDLDTGTEGGLGPAFDIWWEQQTAVLRRMTPLNSAHIVNLGVIDFTSVTPDTLSSVPY